MKKVINEHFNVHNIYLEIELEIWSFNSKVIVWVAKLLNGNQDSMKKLPIQDLKAWVHALDMVIVMLEDPQKKKIIGFV
jgi:hypothetical protein